MVPLFLIAIIKCVIKNAFHYLTLWFQLTEREDKRDEAWAMLQELQHTQTTKIEGLSKGFNQFLAITTGEVSPVKIDPLSALVEEIISEYLINTELTYKLTKKLDKHIQLTYPPSFLKSILNTLLDNALMYRQEDRDLVLQVALYRETEGVVLQIQDNGTGMDMERYGSRLFTPFQRFTKQGEGRGLSLHLVKTMVERNGGSITLHSKPNEGTTVTVCLRSYESQKMPASK